ncbi:MAG TPA: hypothetical protein VHV74_04005 [Pseudonocardiaceae bacterium]|jgi:hypothetical protein|nr:hypothetical protein [Pseudonocardiaceae bacterium]
MTPRCDTRIDVEQNTCLLAPAARSNVLAAVRHDGSAASLTCTFAASNGLVFVTVIGHLGWASSRPTTPTVVCFTQGPAPPGPS